MKCEINLKRRGFTKKLQDIRRSGLRMVDTEIMLKAITLAWIPGRLTPGNPNWKTIQDYHLRRL